MASLVQQVSVKIPIKEELPRSKSIPIPTNISKENLYKLADDEAYMVTSQIFDPRDSSPPNEWNIRLKNRLARFSDISSEIED